MKKETKKPSPGESSMLGRRAALKRIAVVGVGAMTGVLLVTAREASAGYGVSGDYLDSHGYGVSGDYSDSN